jgi:hypothetical protein
MRIVSGSRISPTMMTSGADLHLLHDARVVLVLIFDGIFNRHDMAGVAPRERPTAIEAVARETLDLARPDELVVTRAK